MPRCSECDEAVEAGVIFCPDCGGEVPAPRPAATETTAAGDGADGSGDLLVPDSEGVETGRSQTGEETASPGEEGPDEEATEQTLETDVEGPMPFERGPLTFAATYPTGRGYESVVLGGVAELLGALLPLLQLPVRGYGFRLAGAAARGQATPPAFEDVGELFADGLRVLLITVTYALVVGTVGTAPYVFGQEVFPGFELQAVAVAVLLGIFAMPASLTAYAATRSVGAAFSPEYAGAFLTSGPYAKGALLWLGVLLGLGMAALVSFFTLVAVFFVVAWGWYVSASLWGYYYRQAVAKGVVPSPPDEVVA